VDISEHRADSERHKTLRPREPLDSNRTIGENGCSPMLCSEEVGILMCEIQAKQKPNEMIIISHSRQVGYFFFRFTFILMFFSFFIEEF
jgi:hypothetical protein